jgi:hypothetical protein
MEPGYYWAQFKGSNQRLIVYWTGVVYWTGQYVFCLGSETAREFGDFNFGPKVEEPK